MMNKFRALLLVAFLVPSIVFSQVPITATGASNTFDVNYPANITAVSSGMMVTFFSNQTVTGNTFLNLNGLGSRPILKSVSQQLSFGDILSGQAITVIYDGTNWQLLSVAASNSATSQWTSTTGGTIFYNGGNVGIGTDIANANLTLAPTYTLGWRYSAGNTSVAHSIGRASQGATPLQFNTTFNPGPTGPVFEFNSGAGNILTMLFNKNVGIGTGLPQNTLHVVGGARIENLSTAGAVFSNLSGDLYVNTAAGSLLNFSDNLYTSAPNSTTYAAQLQVIGTTADMDFVISPKGGGSILASAPDGTATGGNKRGGFGSIDLQRYRTQATQVASGTIAVLIGGNYNTASGSMSFVGNGNSNTAAGANATIVNGQQNLISAGNNWSGILNGSNNTIAGTASNAFIGAGSGNLVSGNLGVINGGSSNIASGAYSGIISGIGNVARSYGEVVVGTYNADYTPFSAGTFQSGDRIFTVGNGATSGTRSNAFTILKNGNVALGNINPAYQYDQAITAIVGNESLAHYTVSDAPAEFFLRNASVIAGEFIPQFFGNQIGIGSALILSGETNNDSNPNDPEMVVVNGTFSGGSALGFKPIFAVKNAGSNRFQVAANGTVTIASLTSSGTFLVQANATGRLSLATSSSYNLWTVSGSNIFPQSATSNLGIGLGSATAPGLIAGASRYITLAANQTNTTGYPSVELFSINGTQNSPVSKLDFINVHTPVLSLFTNHARIQAFTGRAAVSNGQLGFFTYNGTLNEVMRINENGGVSIGSAYTPNVPPVSGLMVQGNFGLGTTVPGAKFNIRSNSSVSPNLAMLIQNAGGNNILSLSDNGLLGLGTNLASRAYIEQFGSVGSTAAMFGLSGTGGVSIISNYPGIAFNGYFSSAWTSIGTGYGADIDVNPTDGLISFNTFSNAAAANSTVTATTRMVIMNSGNVGIATPTPTSTLDVNGSISVPTRIMNGNTTLTSTDFFIIIGTTGIATFPAASSCPGRIYIIKVPSCCTGTTSPNYLNAAGTSVNTLAINTTYKFISDGTNWQLW